MSKTLKVSAVLVVIVLVIILFCSPKTNAKDPDRFEVVYGDINIDTFCVFRDTMTDVQYLVVRTNKGTSVCVLQNYSGDPLTYTYDPWYYEFYESNGYAD